MDKEGRLTKWTEWTVGAKYEWLRNGMRIGVFVCLEAEPKNQYVWLRRASSNTAAGFPVHKWKREYRLLPAEMADQRHPIPTE